MAFLKVHAGGLHTTVQDFGREGFLGIGVPPSGTLDPLAQIAANHLVGNNPGAAVLEILVAGPTLEVVGGPARFAVMGGGASIEMLAPYPYLVGEGESVTLRDGATFKIPVLSSGMSACLSVSGGLQLSKVMKSRSTYTRGGFGGFEGRALRSGDLLPLGEDAVLTDPDKRLLALSFFDLPDDPIPIRVIMGPQQVYFTDNGLRAFQNQTFTISPSSDRMGARLEGDPLQMQGFEGFVSDGIVKGAIQVPGSGNPIVLLADHQTSGGYPKIATVISADLPLFGRLVPGRKVRFVPVSVAEAVAALKDQRDQLARVLAGIETYTRAEGLDLVRLYSGNIISGVSDGSDVP